MWEPVARAKRRLSVAEGCSARLSWHVRAGAGAKVAARRRVGGGSHEQAQRRARASRDGGGYQAMRGSNSKTGAGQAGCDLRRGGMSGIERKSL